MSDTLMEKSSNVGVINNASGHVLIAGLGIGLILPAILAKKEVLSVTVIEKYKEVIDLVEPHLHSLPGGEKLHVIESDIFTWKPAKGKKFDTIYFDIWPNVCTDNLREMATLHRKYARCKTSDGWINSWKRTHLKRMREMGY
jgi:spermidine synthase